MIAQLNQGEKVRIRTSGGEIDPNTYRVNFVNRDLVGLTCEETGILIKVNNQRICKILKEKKMSEETTTVMDETEAEVENSENNDVETSEKTEKTEKTQPKPIDFDQMVRDGFEVWSKGGLHLGDDPKVASIQVAAHCVIDPEDTPNRGYEVFNSYNGTRGKKGKGGKRYLFTDKMTLEKKRKTLEKKEYTRHEI